MSVSHGNEGHDRIWEVFGRAKSTDPLAHIGLVRAKGERLARARARMMYSEKPWIELCVVSRDCIHPIVARGTSEHVGFA